MGVSIIIFVCCFWSGDTRVNNDDDDTDDDKGPVVLVPVPVPVVALVLGWELSSRRRFLFVLVDTSSSDDIGGGADTAFRKAC